MRLSRKNLIILASCVVLVAAGAVAWWFSARSEPGSTAQSNTSDKTVVAPARPAVSPIATAPVSGTAARPSGSAAATRPASAKRVPPKSATTKPSDGLPLATSAPAAAVSYLAKGDLDDNEPYEVVFQPYARKSAPSGRFQAYVWIQSIRRSDGNPDVPDLASRYAVIELSEKDLDGLRKDWVYGGVIRLFDVGRYYTLQLVTATALHE